MPIIDSTPWLTEDATRDRSNRLLDDYAEVLKYAPYCDRSRSFSARGRLNRRALRYNAPTAMRTTPIPPEVQTELPRVAPLTKHTNAVIIIDAPPRIHEAPNTRLTKINARPILPVRSIYRLTMRLSDARLRRPKTKLIYPDHRLPPWLTEDAARDRSNRWLDDFASSNRLVICAK